MKLKRAADFIIHVSVPNVNHSEHVKRFVEAGWRVTPGGKRIVGLTGDFRQ